MLDQDKSKTARTKVLVLTDSFLPHAGGSREYYNNIYRNLVELGKTQVTLLTKKIKGWRDFDKTVNTEFFRIRRMFKPLATTKLQELPRGIGPLLHTLWHVVRDRPDIIHTGDLYPQGLIGMTLNKILGIPYVVYCHGEEIPQLDRFRYQPRVRDRIYKNADAVIAASEFTRKNLLRLGVKDERIQKITPGVDWARFKPASSNGGLRQKYGLEGKIVILTVARLVPRKGHRLVLKALAKVCRESPDVHYLIAGTGPDEPHLRAIVEELGLRDRVTFTGYVPSDDLAELYNTGDVMVMANRQEENGDVEGFGIVFLEGSAAGKPVVGGRSGGAVEAIEEGVTGYLVDPDNADELVGVLRKLLLDPELREKLGAAGARRVRAEFNWKTRAEALEALNCKILESRRGVARPSESTHSSVASGDLHRTGAVSKNH